MVSLEQLYEPTVDHRKHQLKKAEEHKRKEDRKEYEQEQASIGSFTPNILVTYKHEEGRAIHLKGAYIKKALIPCKWYSNNSIKELIVQGYIKEAKDHYICLTTFVIREDFTIEDNNDT